MDAVSASTQIDPERSQTSENSTRQRLCVHEGDTGEAIRSQMPVTQRTMAAGMAALLGVVTLIAACGRREPSAATPPPQLRIVAHSPALAVILKDLGYESQIVGRHAYDLVLDPALPSCGELGTIDYETLVRVRPTHVFIQWGARELPDRLRELASTNGWVVQNLNPLGLDEIQAAAQAMDESVFQWTVRGTPAADAAAMSEHERPPLPFEADIKRAWRDRGPGMKRAGRILLLASTKPLGAMGPGSFHHQLLERLGGVPALSTFDGAKFKAAWVTLDLEDLNLLAPDGIVIFAPRPPRSPKPDHVQSPDKLIALMGRAAELSVPAIRNKRVALIDDPLGLTPSTAMIGIADELASIVLGWSEAEREPARAPDRAPE